MDGLPTDARIYCQCSEIPPMTLHSLARRLIMFAGVEDVLWRHGLSGRQEYALVDR